MFGTTLTRIRELAARKGFGVESATVATAWRKRVYLVDPKGKRVLGADKTPFSLADAERFLERQPDPPPQKPRGFGRRANTSAPSR